MNRTGHSTPNRDESLLLQSKKKENKRRKEVVNMASACLYKGENAFSNPTVLTVQS